MKAHWLRLALALAIVLIALGALVVLGSIALARKPDSISTAPVALAAAGDAGAPEAQRLGGGSVPLVLSYAAKFVCQEPLQPGTFWYGPAAPIVEEQTGVLIHNPQPYTVTLYKKAVRARLETAPEIAPGAWFSVTLKPDHAIRIDCDDIAKLLTGDPAATFIGKYGIGVEVEGFVVILVGPQLASGGNVARFGPVDVTAEYVRASEVLKKDISYQPWWIWWWWRDILPWRLGYAYNRVIQVDPTGNIDCRDALYRALIQDAGTIISDTERTLTIQALSHGLKIDPSNLPRGAQDQPALVALIGGCQKIIPPAGQPVADVSYVLVSNKGPTDQDPRGGGAVFVYPWIPGRWHDLTVVVPQNVSKDLDDYIRQWHTQRWIDSGVPAVTVRNAMVYYFPWWCGWGYWWWWWNGGDCIDIGVGEGESLDVEQIVPMRVFMPTWPPR